MRVLPLECDLSYGASALKTVADDMLSMGKNEEAMEENGTLRSLYYGCKGSSDGSSVVN